VSEIVVTGRNEPPPASVPTSPAGKSSFARPAATTRACWRSTNGSRRRQAAGADSEAPDNLEDDDLLEMVNAGLIPAIVVDNYLAAFWKKVFPNLSVLRPGGGAHRRAPRGRRAQEQPAVVGGVEHVHGQVRAGHDLRQRDRAQVSVNTTTPRARRPKPSARNSITLWQFFRKYSDKYDMDFLLMAAQGYQESQLNQNAKSHVGAIGVMQLMPATGREQNVGDITQVEPNIHAGVKYMRVTRTRSSRTSRWTS
jgi:soluble lytic murein transglycosylase-like protein